MPNSQINIYVVYLINIHLLDYGGIQKLFIHGIIFYTNQNEVGNPTYIEMLTIKATFSWPTSVKSTGCGRFAILLFPFWEMFTVLLLRL